MHELCTLLADGQFHSGSHLGQLLGVTRAAVWKKVKKLQQQGIQVVSQPGLGYRIPGGIRLLDHDWLRQAIDPAVMLETLLSVDSTNAVAVRKARSGEDNFLLVAEEQSNGRGRRGRQWCSPYAANLYLTYVWPVTAGVKQIEALSLTAGLALYQALSEYAISGLGVKWPNDLLVGDKKIAGILIELVGDITDRSSAVIGIGINVNVLEQPEVDQPWTSMRAELGRQLDRNQLLEQVFARLQQLLRIQADCGFAALREQWEAAHLWHERMAILCAGDEKITGKVLGVTDTGQLRLQVDGREQLFAGGELSLRLQSDT